MNCPALHRAVRVLALSLGVLVCQARGASPTFRSDPDYLIDTWETEDGLPENSATCMVQDADGFLWLGTQTGLVRFDGVKFTEMPLPLPGVAVTNLHLDQERRLWVFAIGGAFVREGGRWRTLSAATDDWPGGIVRSVSEKADGTLLVTTFEGLLLERVNGRFRKLLPPPGVRGFVPDGVLDAPGKWYVSYNGTHHYAGRWDGTAWAPLLTAEALAGLPVDSAGLASSRDGGVWVLFYLELRKFHNGVETAHITLTQSPGGVSHVFEDSSGYVWISSRSDGLSRVSTDGTMRHWNTADGAFHSLFFVSEDRERNLWVGTRGGGLLRFKPRRFRSFGPGEGLEERDIRSVSPAPGGAWAATRSAGLYHIENGKVIRSTLAGAVRLFSVVADREGHTWVGTLNQGVRVFEKGTCRYLQKQDTGGPQVTAIFEDSRGGIWLSGGESVAMHDKAGVHRYPPLAGVTGIAEDATGAIWLASGSGVFRIEDDHYAEVRDGDTPLSGVLCLYEDDASRSGIIPGNNDTDGMWFYSQTAGLLRWRDGKIVRVPYQGALVSGMVRDRAGFLWMLTGQGVMRMSLTSSGKPEYVRFGLRDGLPGLAGASGCQPVCGRDAEGRLWFATSKGVATINPAELRLNPIPPPVYIESLVYRAPADGTEAEVRLKAPFAHPLTLPPGSRRLEFHFTASCFTALEKTPFKVRLNDEAERAEEYPRRVIEFQDRPPGDYTLHIAAANDDGLWSTAPASLAFTVQPFYWQTAWYRAGRVILLIALGGGFVWWLMRFRHARMEEKLAFQQQRGELAHLGRVASMSELSGSLAHELNQPLTAILSNAQAAKRFMDQDPPDFEEVREILNDIVNEDRRAGEVIRRMRGMLKKGETVMEVLPLNVLTEEVLGMIRSDLVAKNISVTADLAPALPPVCGDRIQLQQVILNLLVNACDAMTDTPSENRMLTIFSSAGDGGVLLAIRDQGHGLGAGAEEKVFAPFYTTKSGGLGMGLAICRSILHAHGGRLTAQNHSGGGAVFRVELPAHVEKAHD
jgi:signal transduction histidine kinase/ligand-binding sensor domain-containing protein